jgi:hypothetical protein
MRGRLALWGAIAVLAVAVAAWSAADFTGLRPFVVWLASQRELTDAFNDPLSARTDALLTLVTLFVLTPVCLGILVGVVIFTVIVALLVTEPVFRSLNSWICVPLVLVGFGVGVWAIHGHWVPHLLYVGGLAAKAGLVFFSPTGGVAR